MVFSASLEDSGGHIYDLVRSLFDVLRDIIQGVGAKTARKDEVITEIKEAKTDNEIKFVKNVEIVIDVFKKAAEKIGKVGERDWREVLEQ